MKKFLIKIILFISILIILLSFILMKYGGFVDYFYQKFTVSRQSSFILGDSRSLQGIQPRIIDRELKNSRYQFPMFNYSFTISQINYGKPYTESIKKKISNSNNGLFIINIHPWLFTKREGDDLQNGRYSERENPPYNMTFQNINPNFEYFIRNFRYFHFRSIIKKTSELHKDGWLEESNLPKDSATFQNWKSHQIELYSDFAKKWKKSPERITEFIKMLAYLQKKGTVVLVRMPIDKKILKIENNFWVDFDEQFMKISKQNKIKYFNFSRDDKYQTYDGNHLDKFGGVNFTKELCDSIKTIK